MDRPARALNRHLRDELWTPASQVVATRQAEAGRVKESLLTELRAAVAQSRTIESDSTLDADEKSQALEDLQTGWGDDEGVRLEDGQWSAWA